MRRPRAAGRRGRTRSAARAGYRQPTAGGRQRCAGRGRGCGRVRAARHSGAGWSRRAGWRRAPSDRARFRAACCRHSGAPRRSSCHCPTGLSRGEQRGEGDPSEPWHGSQDHHVALLAALPRRALLRRDELVAELVQLAVRGLELLIDELEAGSHRLDVSGRGCGHPGSHRQRLLAQDAQHLGGLPTANAVRFENPLDRRLAQPGRLRRARRLVPQIEKPLGRQVVGELQHLRVIAPQLLAHTVGQTAAFALRSLPRRRPGSSVIRDHSRSSTITGSSTDSRRKAWRSVRRLSASTWASRRSSPACAGAGFCRRRP